MHSTDDCSLFHDRPRTRNLLLAFFALSVLSDLSPIIAYVKVLDLAFNCRKKLENHIHIGPAGPGTGEWPLGKILGSGRAQFLARQQIRAVSAFATNVLVRPGLSRLEALYGIPVPYHGVLGMLWYSDLV